MDEILKFISDYVARLIRMLKPKKSVTLVLDGVAPNAKLKD
jgi:5'-3' exonuclease